MSKPIPIPPQVRLIAAIESRRKHPLYPSVVECIEIQDGLIYIGVITDEKRKSLAWVLEMLTISESEKAEDLIKRAKSIERATTVFDGIVANLQREEKDLKRAHEAQPEIDCAKKFCLEIILWAEGGWKEVLNSFSREMRGINPQTLKNHLGFTTKQVTLTKQVEGKPQWGELSLLDIAKRVVEDESVLTNRAFRRATLSAISSFFLFAFGQTGSEESELLDCSDEILTLLYGDGAKLANRSAKKR